jgi:hypothetical protein
MRIPISHCQFPQTDFLFLPLFLAYKFKFTTELGNGYVLRWSPYTYPSVFAAAQRAASDTNEIPRQFEAAL